MGHGSCTGSIDPWVPGPENAHAINFKHDTMERAILVNPATYNLLLVSSSARAISANPSKRMTNSICEKPYGRVSFARMLVEIDSSKALVDNVELWYESLGKILKLWVEYTWVPPRCEEYKVYGHYLSKCAKKVNTVSKVNKNSENERAADVAKEFGNHAFIYFINLFMGRCNLVQEFQSEHMRSNLEYTKPFKLIAVA
ncbi:hypothetical protein CTI12_AA319930 [Artemisia annua]|uniref:Zinc knuckle CX2CX4HX4C n=1 Tax=Artemisia annua TaxID=35608 RepID=A0A2U1MZS9_ARTAN|nr:hypothetical protein CTI12_AA319930 [Artemisia annua]